MIARVMYRDEFTIYMVSSQQKIYIYIYIHTYYGFRRYILHRKTLPWGATSGFQDATFLIEANVEVKSATFTAENVTRADHSRFSGLRL